MYLLHHQKMVYTPIGGIVMPSPLHLQSNIHSRSSPLPVFEGYTPTLDRVTGSLYRPPPPLTVHLLYLLITVCMYMPSDSSDYLLN